MIRYERFSVALCPLLIPILVSAIAPKQVHASDSGAGRNGLPRSVRSSDMGIIGSVESFATVTINGRMAQGKEALWSGDLIEVAHASSARALLDSVGEVLMKRGAIARLSTTLARQDNNAGVDVLVASLIRGEIIVSLNPGAIAYIETDEIVISASGEGSFRVGPGESKPAVAVTAGEVEIQTGIKRRLKVSGSFPRPGPSSTNTLRTNVRRERPVNVKATGTKIQRRTSLRDVVFAPSAESGFNQTSSDEEPLVGRVISFELIPDPPATDIGEIIPPAKLTDQNGEVTVLFRAHDRAGSGRLVARVEHDPAVEDAEVWVGFIKVENRWITRNKIIVAAVAAAVFTAAFLSREKSLKKEGPPRPVP